MLQRTFYCSNFNTFTCIPALKVIPPTSDKRLIESAPLPVLAYIFIVPSVPLFSSIFIESVSLTVEVIFILPVASIAKSVPLPSIFWLDACPNVKPTLAGILTSVPAVKFISVPAL